MKKFLKGNIIVVFFVKTQNFIFRAKLLKAITFATIYANPKIIMENWIEIAKVLLFDLGNAFSFGNICIALEQEMVRI